MLPPAKSSSTIQNRNRHMCYVRVRLIRTLDITFTVRANAELGVRANAEPRGRTAIDIQTATRAEKCLKTIFLKPGGPKNFKNDRSHRCDRFCQISSKSELSSRFFGRLKIFVLFEYLGLIVAALNPSLASCRQSQLRHQEAK